MKIGALAAMTAVMLGVATATAVAYDSTAASLLWRITAPSGARSYVFGTIHLRDSSIFRQRDSVVYLIRAARTVYTEVDIDSMRGGGVNPMRFMLTNGKKLRDFYTPEEYALIKKVVADKLGPMGAMMDMLKPSAVMALLAMDGMEQTATVSMDEFIWQEASAHHVAHKGAERLEEQLSLLESMPPSVLLEFVRDMDKQDDVTSQLIDAYANERLHDVEAMLSELEDLGSFGTSLNDTRNARFVERLQAEFTTGNIFLAIGALHLPGTNGVLARLERMGFRVTPVLGGKRVNLMQVR